MTQLLDMSLHAIPLIVVIIILRALLINRVPKRMFLVLWAVVLCRLFIPITLPSPISIYSLKYCVPIREAVAPPVAPGEDAVRDVSLHESPQTGIYLATTASQTLAVSSQTVETARETHALSLATLLPVLWAIGFTGSTGWFVLTHLRCRRVYDTAMPIQDATVDAWLYASHFRRTIRVRESDQILAPLTYGVLRPVILLPKSLEQGDADRLSYVLAHEGTHIRRFDVLAKWLLAAAVCVHWFNPLVWAMFALAGRDIELCCDEAVVRSFGVTVKSAYATALIGLEETRSRFTPLCNNFSKTAIEERIISIMKYRKTSAPTVLLAAVLILATTAGFAFGAPERPPQAAVSANQGTIYIAATDNGVPVYGKYEAFGISYDAANDKLYYHGQLIRCFDDEYPFGEGAIVGMSHFSEEGVVDVHTVRDLSQPARNADGSLDPGGVLKGVATYSQAEFDARILETRDSAGSGPVYTAIADGTTITNEELVRQYSVYEPFGITYDAENGLLYYRGKLIYHFLDVLASNGEDFASGKFQGAMRSATQEDGELSVSVVRDHNHPDANGFGMIMGVETSAVAPQGFFVETLEDDDQNTESRQQWGEDALPGGAEGVDPALASIEWWTAEEYEAWLAQEKILLQDIIGGRGWNERDGWFVWTQGKVDETIRVYEQILDSIRKGGMVSKPFGDEGAVMMQDIGQMSSAAQSDVTESAASTSAIVTATETVVEETAAAATKFSARIALGNGTEVDLGTFETYVERYKAVEAFCIQQVAAGAMAQAEADAIIRQYM